MSRPATIRSEAAVLPAPTFFEAIHPTTMKAAYIATTAPIAGVNGSDRGSESARANPEALLPRSAGRHALQIAVQPLRREVEGVGDRGHRLEADEAAAIDGIRRAGESLAAAPGVGGIRRPDDGGAIVRSEF